MGAVVAMACLSWQKRGVTTEIMLAVIFLSARRQETLQGLAECVDDEMGRYYRT